MLDNQYIESQMPKDIFFQDGKTIQVPCYYLNNNSAISTRILFNALKRIGVTKDIERKHIELLLNLARFGENGKKIKLPFDVLAYKEYDYLTFENVHIEEQVLDLPLKSGEFEAKGYGKIIVKRAKELSETNALYFDAKKVPKTARWRYKQDGDIFEKFGGGTKKLKSFFIDKKIPSRIRKLIPVLADGNEIYVIAGIEISDKVKVDSSTQVITMVKVEK